MNRWLFASGSFSAAVAVALGAFGAHALKEVLSGEMLSVFETGCRYQMYHALALIALSAAASHWKESYPLFRAAGIMFIAGTVLFSGSLYLYAAVDVRSVVVVTPVGGILFLAGWITSFLAVRKRNIPPG